VRDRRLSLVLSEHDRSAPGSGRTTRGRDASADVDRQFGHIYRSEAPWLVRFFRRRLGNAEDAQDMTQETMIRFLRAAPASGIETPQAYLRRIAANLLRDRFAHSSNRLAERTSPLIEGLDTPDTFDQHRNIASRQELNAWEAILEQLKPNTLEIFLLSRVDGYSYQEIASRLGITTRIVKRHMQKAIAHVARHRGEL
jgi:RNA polymerase sigma factor (sigma-70 family)